MAALSLVAQTAPDILLNRVSGLPGASQATFGTHLRPTWAQEAPRCDVGKILGVILEPLNHEKQTKTLKSAALPFSFKAFKRSAKSSQQRPPERPQGPQKRPRRRQERPRRAPRARRGPGAPRSHPKIVLNGWNSGSWPEWLLSDGPGGFA